MSYWSLVVGCWLLVVSCLANPAVAQENSCITCHKGYEGRLGEPVRQWEKSVHKGKEVTCEKCHGGDPSSVENAMDPRKGFVGKPSPFQIPELCAKCHANPSLMRRYNLATDQFALYKTSIHGKRLYGNKDAKVATCVSCHGLHDIRSPKSPVSPVFRSNVPATCGKCHADEKYMKPYKIPTSQLAEYKESFHGELLLKKNDLRAPNCADCHGVHGATPPGISEVADVCGRCHSNTEENYNQSPHRRAVAEVGVPRCIDCHGNHKILYPTARMFLGDMPGHCGSCHAADSPQYQLAQKFSSLVSSLEAAAMVSEKDIGKIRRAGLDTGAVESQLVEARSKLIEAIPYTHSLELTKVAPHIEEGLKTVAAMDLSIMGLQREVFVRRVALIIVFVVVLGIILLFYLKLKSLNRKA